MANTHFSGPLVVPGGVTANVTGTVYGGVIGSLTGTVNGITFATKAGAPTTDSKPPGTILLDTTGFDLYINVGTLAEPSWMKFTRATT